MVWSFMLYQIQNTYATLVSRVGLNLSAAAQITNLLVLSQEGK